MRNLFGGLSRALTIGLAAGLPAVAAAQWTAPAHRAAYEAASQRVVSARIAPSPLRLAVGDTVQVRVDLLDASGQVIMVKLSDGRTVAPAFYLSGQGFTRVTGDEDVLADATPTQRIVGTRPSATATIMYPIWPNGPNGKFEYKNLAVPIVVTERATERIAIHPTPFEPYVGSSIPLAAEVWKKGYPLSDPAPRVAWRSSNPEIAAVTDAGTVSFLTSGRVTITATNGGKDATKIFEVKVPAVARITLAPSTREARTGDVVRLGARALGRDGAAIEKARLNLAVSSDRGINARAGAAAYDDGTFVAEEPGLYTVIAELGGVSARTSIRVGPRNADMIAERVSHTSRRTTATTEIMVFEGVDGRDYAYIGALGEAGGWVIVYDVTNPASPVATDSVYTDARNVNDIRVDREKGARLGVFTKEGAPDRKNGIVLLDLTVPAHPKKLSEYSATTTAGVHDAWIYENRVYATNDGTGDVHIIDVSDVKNPKEVGRWSTGTPGRYVHDLVIENGIAYLAYWDDGLVILDVGGLKKGGTPDKPMFVSRIAYGPGGHTHHAIRYKQYVFVADEGPQFIPHPPTGASGYVHVFDVSDIEHPREVAKFYAPEVGAHNVWLDNDKLYIAYYQGGLRVVDVSGELRGDLYQQGRQIAWYHTKGEEGFDRGAGQSFAWSPQFHKGNVFVSDMLSGMWVIKLTPKTPVTP